MTKNKTPEAILDALITKDSATLLIIGPEVKKNKIYSILAFYLSLKHKGYDIVLYLEDDLKKKLLLTDDLDNLNLYDSTFSSDIIIKLEQVGDKIKDVTWKKENKDLNIYIKTENGDVNTQNIQIKHLRKSYSSLIYYGVEDIKTYPKDLYQHNPDVTKIKNPTDIEELIKSKQTTPEHENEVIIAIAIRNFLNLHSLPIQDEIATYLLKSLYLETESFSKNVTSEVFEVSAQLLKNGGEIKHISEESDAPDTRTINKKEAEASVGKNSEEKDDSKLQKVIPTPVLVLKDPIKKPMAIQKPETTAIQTSQVANPTPTFDPLAPASEPVVPLHIGEKPVEVNKGGGAGPLPPA